MIIVITVPAAVHSLKAENSKGVKNYVQLNGLKTVDVQDGAHLDIVFGMVNIYRCLTKATGTFVPTTHKEYAMY